MSNLHADHETCLDLCSRDFFPLMPYVAGRCYDLCDSRYLPGPWQRLLSWLRSR
jgi:hypothetical protein